MNHGKKTLSTGRIMKYFAYFQQTWAVGNSKQTTVTFLPTHSLGLDLDIHSQSHKQSTSCPLSDYDKNGHPHHVTLHSTVLYHTTAKLSWFHSQAVISTLPFEQFSSTNHHTHYPGLCPEASSFSGPNMPHSPAVIHIIPHAHSCAPCSRVHVYLSSACQKL